VSPDETRRIGERLGAMLQGGEVLGLAGPLGAGKTCLIQGIARGLSIPEKEVVSPTYTIIHELSGRLRFFHIDLYRIPDADELENTGFYEAFEEDSVTVIEWADLFPDALPESRLMIGLEYSGASSRRIIFSPRGDRYRGLVDALLGDLFPGRKDPDGGHG